MSRFAFACRTCTMVSSQGSDVFVRYGAVVVKNGVAVDSLFSVDMFAVPFDATRTAGSGAGSINERMTPAAVLEIPLPTLPPTPFHGMYDRPSAWMSNSSCQGSAMAMGAAAARCDTASGAGPRLPCVERKEKESTADFTPPRAHRCGSLRYMTACESTTSPSVKFNCAVKEPGSDTAARCVVVNLVLDRARREPTLRRFCCSVLRRISVRRTDMSTSPSLILAPTWRRDIMCIAWSRSRTTAASSPGTARWSCADDRSSSTFWTC